MTGFECESCGEVLFTESRLDLPASCPFCEAVSDDWPDPERPERDIWTDMDEGEVMDRLKEMKFERESS